MIELDVQLSRDRAVIVLHDDTLDRTTDGTGPAAARTLAELAALDAGAWFGPAFAGERIPTLAQVLAATSLPVNVELKAGGGRRLVEETLRVVAAAKALGRVAIARRAGLAVRAWTVNDAAELGLLEDAGVSGIFTDYPERFLQPP